MTRPADSLINMDLGNGWTVVEKITKKPNSTGGAFSVGYKVKNVNGDEAFLKALDFSGAFNEPDPPSALSKLTELYLFERDLLAKCRDKKLDRIMTPILDGKVTVQGFGPLGQVFYLIFELASGDIRGALQDFSKLDLLWSLTSLHNVAVGLNQLHKIEVAHQDVKPSNVLFVNSGSKLSDLGRACDKNRISHNDSITVAPDLTYAPVDLYYPNTGVTGFEKRVLTDLYLLGSLFFFHFSGISAAHALQSKLRGSRVTNHSFTHDLPYLQHAFDETLSELRHSIETVAGPFTPEILLMAKQLCEPDPTKRGDQGWRGSKVPMYNLQRYISKLDAICKRVEIGLR